jgi:hypothetical protein
MRAARRIFNARVATVRLTIDLAQIVPYRCVTLAWRLVHSATVPTKKPTKKPEQDEARRATWRRYTHWRRYMVARYHRSSICSWFSFSAGRNHQGQDNFLFSIVWTLPNNCTKQIAYKNGVPKSPARSQSLLRQMFGPGIYSSIFLVSEFTPPVPRCQSFLNS